jgi:hypothetical protein
VSDFFLPPATFFAFTLSAKLMPKALELLFPHSPPHPLLIFSSKGHCHAVTMSHCTVKQKGQKMPKMPKLHVTSDKYRTVTLSYCQIKKNVVNAKTTYVTGDCHTVTPKRPKILKMTKVHVTTTNVRLSRRHAVTLSHLKSQKS